MLLSHKCVQVALPGVGGSNSDVSKYIESRIEAMKAQVTCHCSTPTRVEYMCCRHQARRLRSCHVTGVHLKAQISSHRYIISSLPHTTSACRMAIISVFRFVWMQEVSQQLMQGVSVSPCKHAVHTAAAYIRTPTNLLPAAATSFVAAAVASACALTY